MKDVQTRIVLGRYIVEKIRLTVDLIQECQDQNISGIIMLIDYVKAFDTSSWQFIENMFHILKKFVP